MVERCSKRVWGGTEGYQCSRKSVVKRKGEWFCRQHDPVAVKERRTAREAKWDAEDKQLQAARERSTRIHEAERRVIEAAKAWSATAYTIDPLVHLMTIREAVMALEEAERG